MLLVLVLYYYYYYYHHIITIIHIIISYNMMKMNRTTLQITYMHSFTYNTHFIFTFIALSLLSLIQHATQLLTHMHIHLYSTRHLPHSWHLWILHRHCLESFESPLTIQRKLPCAAEYHHPIVTYCIHIYYVTTHWY